jgi:hypothetical protein
MNVNSIAKHSAVLVAIGLQSYFRACSVEKLV